MQIYIYMIRTLEPTASQDWGMAERHRRITHGRLSKAGTPVPLRSAPRVRSVPFSAPLGEGKKQ